MALRKGANYYDFIYAMEASYSGHEELWICPISISTMMPWDSSSGFFFFECFFFSLTALFPCCSSFSVHICWLMALGPALKTPLHFLIISAEMPLGHTAVSYALLLVRVCVCVLLWLPPSILFPDTSHFWHPGTDGWQILVPLVEKTPSKSISSSSDYTDHLDPMTSGCFQDDPAPLSIWYEGSLNDFDEDENDMTWRNSFWKNGVRSESL